MLRKIIALAVAGLMSGAAFAQSNVVVYGDLDIGYLNGKTDTKTTTAGVVTAKNSNSISTTGFETGAVGTNKIGFMGTEDLGNGLKADFKLEFGLNETSVANGDNNRIGGDSGGETNTLGGLAIRKQVLGLSGGFGRFAIGRDDVIIENTWSIGLTGMKNNATGSIYTSGQKLNDTRANETMTYTSPSFSGFTVAAQYGKGKNDDTGVAATDTSHKKLGLTAAYANGPLNVGLGYSKEQGGNVVAAASNELVDAKVWMVAANYNFGIAKVFGLYFDGSNDLNGASDSRDGWELGVHVPVTAQITAFGSYYDVDKDTKTAAGVKTGGDGDGFQLGALYSLSKRTTAYVAYGDMSFDDSTAATAVKRSTDGRQWAVGLKHSF